MDKRWLGIVFVILLEAGSSNAQTAPLSDPQALALAAQSVAAMTGGSQTNDINLTGTAVWTAGSDQQKGNVTLSAKGFAESRMELAFSDSQRSEIRNSSGGLWAGTDGIYHDIALHNCWTDASWFFPALGSLASSLASKPDIVFTYIGSVSTQPQLQHLRAYMYNATFPDVQQLSAMDFYMDSRTSLPAVVTFNEHPDIDQGLNIPVQVMFSDYRNVNGAMIPFHIQRYVNNSLRLDIQLVSTSVNSGISDSQFSLQ